MGKILRLQGSLPRAWRWERTKRRGWPLSRLARGVQLLCRFLGLLPCCSCGSPLLSGFVSQTGPTQKTTGLSRQLDEVPEILVGVSQLRIKIKRLEPK